MASRVVGAKHDSDDDKRHAALEHFETQAAGALRASSLSAEITPVHELALTRSEGTVLIEIGDGTPADPV